MSGILAGAAFAYLTGNYFGHAVTDVFMASAPGVDPQLWEVIGVGVQCAGGCAAWRAVQRSMRGAMAGFWHSTLGRYVIGRIAGTAVFAALAKLGLVIATYGLAYVLGGIAAVFGLKAVAALFPAFQVAVYALAAAFAWPLRTPVKVTIGKGTRRVRRLYRSLYMGCGGSAAFATIFDEWANRWRPGMIFLGHSMHDRFWPVGIKDDRMMLTIGSNGSGKGETSILTNLLQYPGSVFCNDVKGQNAAVSAQRRREMGQKVYILNPMNSLGKGTAHLNPLNLLDPNSKNYVEDIFSIVDALVVPSSGNNRFWDEAARTVIAGAIDFLMRRCTGEFVPPADYAKQFEDEQLDEEEPVNE
jgi:type IV secretory pathway TraG/TraD family ATPase VirD4